jgi:hydrogenase/urease accessory protein HupE
VKNAPSFVGSFGVALLALLFCGGSASAHPLLQNVLWLKFDRDRVHVAIDVSVREIALTETLPEDFDGLGDDLKNAVEKHGAYVLKHLRLEMGGQMLSGRVTKITPPTEYGFQEQTRYQYELEYPVDDRAPAKVLTLRQDVLREVSYAPGQPWEVTYNVRFQRYGAPNLEAELFLPNEPLSLPTSLDGAAPEGPSKMASAARTFGEYFRHGVMHILTGYDHLLFVSALVLAAASFWEMFKVIAAFTLAHTLTLTLSVFNVVRLPSSIVEPLISASIVFVAVENILWPGRARSWVRLAVAFGFGLVHGLGFAGGLLDAMEGMPVISLSLALVAFSVGVEVGHQVVVLPLFGLLRYGNTRWPTGFRVPVLRYGSICISLAGLYYLVDALRSGRAA